MPVNSTHLDYDAALPAWLRARDVIAGEDAVKAAGTRYLPRLDLHSDDDYAAYKARSSFFNATARTAEGYLGLVFRRPPFVKLPEDGRPESTSESGRPPSPRPSPEGRGRASQPATSSALVRALTQFRNDADMLGTALLDYAKTVVSEVIGVGRAGTLIDWESEVENRVYASLYAAENIINWRVERINGRNIPTMVVLREMTERSEAGDQRSAGDEFTDEAVEQIRVLRLVKDVPGATPDTTRGTRVLPKCIVELWQQVEGASGKARRGKREWKLVETRVPLRLGKPLPLLPFVFHGPRHAQPAIEKLPLGDIIAVNLDHYRLDADYKHGTHYTALPTAWVSGFPMSASLQIGSKAAWMTDTIGAKAGFLEFTGQGLTTFERAMDRDEKLLSVLGSRLLESQKKVGETAQAIELRQSGENSILANIASSVSASVTQVLRWAYWWNSTEESPDDITNEQVMIELNTDFSTKGLSA